MDILKKNQKTRQNTERRKYYSGFALIAALLLAGCTQSTDAIESAEQTPNAPGTLLEKTEIDQAKDESGAKIVREKSTVSKKGTNIPVLVNRIPITNYDIQRRASFLKLRRISGNRTQKATEELIEEKLKMQEAAIRGTLATDNMVDNAFASFAKRNKLSLTQMSQVLSRAGVPPRHFKEFLRVQISWQRTVGTKLRGNAGGISQSDALFNIRKSGEAKPETREFKLQQIIFVVPQDKRKKLLRARGAEARAFSQRFTSCSDTLGQIKQLRDVSIKELGRVLEPELPERWKEEVIKTQAGKTTRTIDTDKGVEIIAVCSIRNASDDRAVQAVSRSKEFSSLNTEGSKVADEYLKELRGKATIVYR
ncbi:MAG: peptidylprolyl isomerase [Rhizobiaceae bacterium]|nr:peptidylprolyl isomerase [Rhizobiaceae bacterium]